DLVAGSGSLGIRDADTAGSPATGALTVDLGAVNARVRRLAQAQSTDIRAALEEARVRVVTGTGRLLDASRVEVTAADGAREVLAADAVLLAVGARPRVLPTAAPDGE